MFNETLDKVAMAIQQICYHEISNRGFSYGPFKKEEDIWRSYAKEAITALKNVDDSVLEAGYNALFEDKYDGSQAPLMHSMWEAMIKKILENTNA